MIGLYGSWGYLVTFAREGMAIILLIACLLIFWWMIDHHEKKYGSKRRGKGVKK